MTVPFGKENATGLKDKDGRDIVEKTELTFRVAGLTLVSGDEIPPELNALVPEDWKQTGTKQVKPEAQSAQGELK